MNVHKNAKQTPRALRKWVARFKADGVEGLIDRSSRPHTPRGLKASLQRQPAGPSPYGATASPLFCHGLFNHIILKLNIGVHLLQMALRAARY